MINFVSPPQAAATSRAVRRAAARGSLTRPTAPSVRQLRHVRSVARDAVRRIDVDGVRPDDVAVLVAWHDTLLVLLAGLADMLRDRRAGDASYVTVAEALRSELRDLTVGTGLPAVVADGKRLLVAIDAAAEVVRNPADRKMLTLAHDAVEEVVRDAQECRCG